MIKKEQLAKFLRDEEIRDLITGKEFDSLYKKIPNDLRSSLTELFYNKIGVNPLKHMTQIPCYFMMGSCNIKDLQIPHNVEYLRDLAFCECTKLESVKFSEYSKVTHLPHSSFISCVTLKEIILPPNLVEIGYKAFKDCVNLEKIDLPSSIGILNQECFRNCTELTQINLPSTLRFLYRMCFIGCKNLDIITYDGTCDEFKKKVMVFNGAFIDTNITSIKCSDGDLPLTELDIYM
jgi:hypothetical protein